LALEGGERSASCPGRSLPLGKTQYPLYRRLGGLQGRSGQVWKISPPPGFDTQTFQPVASRYTDYAIRPTHCNILSPKFNNVTNNSVKQSSQYLDRTVLMIIIAFEEYFLGNCNILEIRSQQKCVQTGNGLNVNYYRQL